MHPMLISPLLLVARSKKHLRARTDILDCKPSLTLCTLLFLHRLQRSSRLEHFTVHDLAHILFADGTFHADRLEVLGLFKCTHRYLGLYTI